VVVVIVREDNGVGERGDHERLDIVEESWLRSVSQCGVDERGVVLQEYRIHGRSDFQWYQPLSRYTNDKRSS
jgi:hypothetical protein